MRNIKIIIEYDGTNYSGWQIQKNTRETIQQKIEEALRIINKKAVRITGAGRTDAGVHALGQVANFSLDVSIPLNNLPLALNRLLPGDIVCKEACGVTADFHARYDARGKKYCYRILNHKYPSAFKRNYVYYIRKEFDIGLMQKAAIDLEGTHDFIAFQASGSSVTDTVRTIESIEISQQADEVWIEVRGSGFLYNMVRIITGTLIEVGTGLKTPRDIQRIIASKERRNAGFTAPAQGLILMKVYY